jgi:hypothetical protein
MLGSEFFNHDIIRIYTEVFGNLFNDIYVEKRAANGARKGHQLVPIQYGPIAKHVALDERNPITTQVQVQLPRMAYQLGNIEYRQNSKTSPLNRNTKQSSVSSMKYSYAEVPWDLNYTLYIYAKTFEDASQIVSQILPYFQPDFTPTVNLIPELDLKFDTKVTLLGVDIGDEFEGGTDEPRMIQWTLTFKVQGYFLGPISTQGIIKRVLVDLIPVPGADPITEDDLSKYGRAERITIIPGLTSDGHPTANSAATIPYNQIEPTDDYGIITELDTFDDGKKYNPYTGNDEEIK